MYSTKNIILWHWYHKSCFLFFSIRISKKKCPISPTCMQPLKPWESTSPYLRRPRLGGTHNFCQASGKGKSWKPGRDSSPPRSRHDIMADVDPHPGPLLTFFQGIVKSDAMCFLYQNPPEFQNQQLKLSRHFWLRGTINTSLKTNISPENWWLENEIPFNMVLFQGTC